MTPSSPPQTRPVPITPAGMIEGARLSVPLLPGVIVFAAAFGGASAEKGLTLVETTLMSLLVYAGAGQLLALELWPRTWSTGALTAMVAVVVAVNLRFLLMSAALQPWLSRMPRGSAYLALASLTDANFIIGSRYHAKGGEDAGVFIGAGLFLWIIWTLATIPGHMLGGILSDPRRFGLDMIMPLIFTSMAVSMFRIRRDRLAWPIAAGVALGTSLVIDGYWFIVVGALAGSIAAGLFRDR